MNLTSYGLGVADFGGEIQFANMFAFVASRILRARLPGASSGSSPVRIGALR